MYGGRGGNRPDLVLHRVGYETLQLTIVERGALESADNRDVLCRVKAGNKGSTVATTIKWVIDDGSQVRQGQLICELDDSGLQEQLKTQNITVDRAKSDWISAEENYKIVESQNLSDIKTAEINVRLAELDLEKYIDGELEQSRKDIANRIKEAESNLEMWRERAAWSERMEKRGYVGGSQVQAEKAKLQAAQIALEKVREESRVLEQYTRVRTETELRSKVEEAKRALDRVIKQAEAKRVTADADRLAKRSVYEQELARKQDLEEEIKKCTIVAPQDGTVVYFVEERSRGGMGAQQSIIAQGEPVREGQKLIRIPDLRRMVVNTKVHEALISRVRGEIHQPTGFYDSVRSALLTSPDALTRMVSQWAFAELREKFRDKETKMVYGGHPALIRIDAFPDRVLKGHVKSVATVASQADWMSADVKTYPTIVAIDEPVEGLKPNMSAEVTIFASKSLENVLAIPVQAVLGQPGSATRRCYVLNEQGEEEEREIVVGMSNDKMVEVKSGLRAGELVILNPKGQSPEKVRGLGNHSETTAAASAPSGEQAVTATSPKTEKGAENAASGEAGEGKVRRKDGPKSGSGKGDGNLEEMQKRRREFEDKMRKATPAERKQMLDMIPEQFREQARQRYKQLGIEIPD